MISTYFLVSVFQGGDPESGEEVVTKGGPDSGAFCVFPFIWKSKVYRSCAMVRKVLSIARIIFTDPSTHLVHLWI